MGRHFRFFAIVDIQDMCSALTDFRLVENEHVMSLDVGSLPARTFD